MGRILLCSQKTANDLINQGCGKQKSLQLKPPKNIPEKYLYDFIRGFFDGDGSYHYHYDNKSNRYRYSFEVVGSSPFIMEQIQSYLLSNDIKTHIYTRKSPSSNNSVYRFMTGSKKKKC